MQFEIMSFWVGGKEFSKHHLKARRKKPLDVTQIGSSETKAIFLLAQIFQTKIFFLFIASNNEVRREQIKASKDLI